MKSSTSASLPKTFQSKAVDFFDRSVDMKIILFILLVSSMAMAQERYSFEGATPEFDLKIGGEITPKCFQFVGKSRKLVDLGKCKPSKVRSTWKNGACWELSESENSREWAIKLPAVNCKPAKTEFKVLRFPRVSPHDKMPFSQYCLEVDTETMGKKYQNSIAVETCRPKNVRKLKMIVDGYMGCYEVDAVKGEKAWASPLADNLCGQDSKPGPTRPLFVVTGAPLGYGHKPTCFEVDHETGGQKYKVEIPLASCKPLAIKKVWTTVRNIEGCYEVDAERGHHGWYVHLDAEECPKNPSENNSERRVVEKPSQKIKDRPTPRSAIRY